MVGSCLRLRVLCYRNVDDDDDERFRPPSNLTNAEDAQSSLLLPMTARSQWVWITGSVVMLVTLTLTLTTPSPINVSRGNRVHCAESPTRLCCPNWIDATACRLSQGKVSTVSTAYNFIIIHIIQCGSTRKINLHTTVHIFFFSFYRGVKGDYCGKIAIVKAT